MVRHKTVRQVCDWFRCESGDTLVEVVFALTLLSSIILSSTTLAVKAYQMGQTAGERTILSNEAQKQIENLRDFRNNYPWEEFLHGVDDGGDIKGVMIAAIPAVDGQEAPPNATPGSGCRVYQPCMHTRRVSAVAPTYSPWGGGMSGRVPTSYLEMSVTPDSLLDPQRVDVIVSYGSETIGGGVPLKGHIKTTFVKSQLAVEGGSFAPPAAVPTSTCTEGDKDIVLVLDVSGSMGGTWQNRGAPDFDPTVLKINKQKSVANSFVTQALTSRPGNRIAVVFFNSAVVGTQAFSSNIGTLTNAINARNAGGTTAYIPPLTQAQKVLDGTAGLGLGARPGHDQIIVFVSDGRPNQDGGSTASNTARQNLIWAKRATMANSKLYSVGVDGDPLMFNILRGMSDRGLTGGFFGDAGSPGQLDAVFNAISDDLACPGGVGSIPPVLPPPPPPNPNLCVASPHNMVLAIDDSQYISTPWTLPDPMTKQFAWSLDTLSFATNTVNMNINSRIISMIHNSLDGPRDTGPYVHSTLGTSNLLTSGQAHGLPDWSGGLTRGLQLVAGGGDILIFVAFGPRSAAQLAAGMASNPAVLAATKVYTVGVDATSPSDYTALAGLSAAGKPGGFYSYAESSDDLRAAYEEITNDIRCNG